MLLRLSLFVSLATAIGCAPDPCEEAAEKTVHLGQGVGGAFAEFADKEEVSLTVAPQGGFGVAVIIETTGITATDETKVNARLVTEVDGAQTGDFLLEGAPLLCKSDGEGGSISGVVVGFDPDTYRSNDDLLALDGTVVDLVVTVSDAKGDTTVRKPVTVRVGG